MKVAHRIRAERFRRHHLGDLGSAQLNVSAGSASGAIGTAATGAKIGTAILPGIGTAVGAVLGAAASLVGARPPSQAEQTWDSYKKSAGQLLGRNYSEKDFAEIVKGAFDTNKNILKVEREQLLARIAGAIVDAIRSGRVPPSANARDVYSAVIRPTLAANNSDMGRFDGHPTMAPLFVDIADRYLSNLPITRADMPTFANQGYSVHAPLLFTALGIGGNAPQGAGAATMATPGADTSLLPAVNLTSGGGTSFFPTASAPSASAPVATSAVMPSLGNNWMLYAFGAGALLLFLATRSRGRK